jgi:acyl-homoserine-lactone acylase
MNRILLTFIAILTFSFANAQTSIRWDEWGVPHITAKTVDELMYAQGWAQMKLHANMITELYGRARGKGAEYWGAEKIQEDMMIQALGFPELAEKWTRDQDPEYKKMIASFVAGLNAYAQAHPESIKEINRKILPLTVQDANAHAIFIIFGRFVGGEEMGAAMDWKEMGSNTWAIAPSRSADKHALLVQNPHLPWFGEFTFTEAHLMLPGKNLYGSTLVGLPGIAIGFNDNLGWSHTNNTIDNCDTYELTLKDDGYLLDGVKMPFTKKTKILRYKDADGSMKEKEITLLSSLQGPVVNMGKNKALVIRMPGEDRPNAGLQWWHMINASSFEEFETALKMAQIPFWNVMYADKKGNIFYLFNGLVPKRAEGGWDFWSGKVPGDKSMYIWNDVHPYADLPKVKNPSTGWLQNTNDPPWSSTYPFAIKSSDFPGYMSPHYMGFRNQRSIRMLMEDNSITFGELEQYKLSTHMELADRLLADLNAAVDQYGSPLSKQARDVLQRWDRTADATSPGGPLFAVWAGRMNFWDQSAFAKKWDEQGDPLHTPSGLADPKKAVENLDSAAMRLLNAAGRLDASWGQVFRLHREKLDLPGNGADGELGVFRVVWSRPEADNKMYAQGGDSWVGLIDFGDKPKARVLLSYGNSSQEGDPHNGDQLKLFSAKQMRDAYFDPKEVSKHTIITEVRSGKGFVKK